MLKTGIVSIRLYRYPPVSNDVLTSAEQAPKNRENHHDTNGLREEPYKNAHQPGEKVKNDEHINWPNPVGYEAGDDSADCVERRSH